MYTQEQMTESAKRIMERHAERVDEIVRELVAQGVLRDEVNRSEVMLVC